MKVKRENRLMSIIDEIQKCMGDTDTSTKSRYFINDWYLEQIFSLYMCGPFFQYVGLIICMPIPNPFALKIKFYALSHVKWSMFYILP